jgi:aldehyde:ferredoxin oxidoreductase
MTAFGRLLRIDLTTRTWRRETVDGATLRAVIGGRGLSSSLLADAVDPTADPLGPGNRLVFTTGPATGTTLPLSGRVTVGARSPLTGTIGFSSGGEFFGAALRQSGADALVFEGEADRPVYVVVRDGRVEFRDAGALWGLDTHATCDRLRDLEGDRRLRIACIGPAGENRVRFACVVNDKYGVAARGGLGAVMGAKRLKAVAAPAGPPAPVARPERVEALGRRLREILDGHRYMQLLARYGTTITVDEVNRWGLYPTRNFQAGSLPGSERYHEVLFGDGWVVADRHGYEDPLRQYKLADVGGEVLDVPEYESTFALGGLVGIPVARDPVAVLRANHLCNALGMDSISAGGAVAFLLECAQRSLVPPRETGGVPLDWGRRETLWTLLEQIAHRRGIGDLLAEGVRRAAERLGGEAPRYAMHVKGLELPGYDPRGAFGMGLAYATGNRGGCHVEAYMMRFEVWAAAAGDRERALDRFDASERKVRATIWMQNFTCAYNGIGTCAFPFESLAWNEADLAAIFEAVTGLPLTPEEVLRAGERTINLERLFNRAAGFGADDDTLPVRFLAEPLPEGASRDRVVPLAEMLPVFYRLRGWGTEGAPAPATLAALGLAGHPLARKGEG